MYEELYIRLGLLDEAILVSLQLFGAGSEAHQDLEHLRSLVWELMCDPTVY